MALLNRPRRGPLRGALCRLGLFLLLGVPGGVLAPSPARAQITAAGEYQLKAVFLFNFLQVVEWPDHALPPVGAPIRIGVLGDDPFGRVLDDIVRGELVKERPLGVMRSDRVEDLLGCQIVFVSRSERHRLPAVLGRLSTTSILTVGDTGGFARQGGVINFFIQGGKLKFEINAASAQRQQLKLNSQLLSLGRIVEPAIATP